MVEVEGVAGRVEDGELSTFRSDPETFLTTEGVDVRKALARGNEFAVDPTGAVTRVAAGGAGHHAALPGRSDGHFGLAGLVREHHDSDVLFQKGNIVTEGCGGFS